VNNWDAGIKSIFIYGAGSWGHDFYLDNIDASWTVGTVTTYTVKDVEAYIYRLWSDEVVNDDVQDIPSKYLFAGAKIRVRAIPTTKGGTDYRIDDDYIIKRLEWTHDGFAKLECGLDELEKQSPEETLIDLIARGLHSSTQT
jgi:hypothetical protein